MKTYQKKLCHLWMLLLFALSMPVTAQINWPADQILPSFPKPAQTQDLILIRPEQNGETSKRWEAEGNQISHNTGRLESDGWLCQTGIDEPQKYMVYGPYDNSIPVGNHTAEFRLKTDNITAEDNSIVDIDVRNATTGENLGMRTITRRQFSVAGSYVTFELPFRLDNANQAIELRIFWHGLAYTKVDYVAVKAEQTNNNGDDHMYLFSSLKGIVNRKQPRIFSYEGDENAEGRYTWLRSLNLDYREYQNNWELLTKYRDEIKGLVVYDPAEIHTVNLAAMIAGEKTALVVSPRIANLLTVAPYNLSIVEDLRGRFSNNLQVYETVFNEYWPKKNKRILMSIPPTRVKSSVREYVVALGLPTIWLDPEIPAESALLNKFLASMPADGHCMGWWANEAPGIQRASEYGIPTIPSDYSDNLTMHSGFDRNIRIKPIPPKPSLRNKIYVAFILSDGDNLQYVEHEMRRKWSNPERGSVPIGWTVSPAMADAMPGALNYFYDSATDNDNLISGPSGLGYIYPNFYPSDAQLTDFVKRTEAYNNKTGLRVTTIWNTITGGIDPDVGEIYANNAPSLLGLTGQNTGGPLSIYSNKLPGKPLSCNYCWDAQNMGSHIVDASRGWNRNEPRFIIIQSQPWRGANPAVFKQVADGLNADYEVVRPDHLFQLLRESEGLNVNLSTKGFTIEAEQYSEMKGIQTEPCSEGGENVGYTDPGDWLNYANIDFPTSGDYQIEYRIASAVGGGKFSSDLNAGTINLGEMEVPNTGGWQNWRTISQTVTINAGTYQFGLFSVTGGWNLNWIKITPVGAAKTSLETVTSTVIYPNPVTNTLFFTTDGSEISAKVYDIQGREVASGSNIQNGTSMDLSGLTQGLYLVQISKNGTKEKVQQFIKN